MKTTSSDYFLIHSSLEFVQKTLMLLTLSIIIFFNLRNACIIIVFKRKWLGTTMCFLWQSIIVIHISINLCCFQNNAFINKRMATYAQGKCFDWKFLSKPTFQNLSILAGKSLIRRDRHTKMVGSQSFLSKSFRPTKFYRS